MLVVGLTGGIATGKSTVSTLLKAHGVPVVDADILARQVVEPGTRAHSQIIAFFGEDICLPNGTLDRPKLGALVFNDGEKRKKLNSIVHPAVRKAMVWEVVRCWWRGEKFCVLDVPLLIEAGLWQWVGKIVVVACSDELQMSRLMSRDQFEEETARSRVASQMPISDKVTYADEVLDNSGSKEDLSAQVDALVEKFYREVRWTWKLQWLVPPVAIAFALYTLGIRNLRKRRARARKTR